MLFVPSQVNRQWKDTQRRAVQQTFNGIKANTLDFVLRDWKDTCKAEGPRRPVSAPWPRKDGISDVIKPEYVVDAKQTSGLSVYQIHEESGMQSRV